MSTANAIVRTGGRAAVAGLLAAVTGYAAYAAVAWYRYGRHRSTADPRVRDELLDRFMPRYDVVERHQIDVAAPAEITMAAAREQDLMRVTLIRAVFKAREIAMGATSGASQPQGLLAATQALGWGVLADIPGREVVMGAFTKPWEADVTFRALPPGEFAAFSDPGFVKIVWTLRADPIDSAKSVFRTETRVIATDAEARHRFRRYWAFASPGIALIRHLSLRPLRREAERRARAIALAVAGDLSAVEELHENAAMDGAHHETGRCADSVYRQHQD